MAVLMKNNNNNKNLPKIISAPQETYNYKKKAFHESFEMWDW